MYVMTQNERLFINIKHFECISIDNVDDSCYTIAGHYHNDNQEAVEFGVYGDFKGASSVLFRLSCAVADNSPVFYMPDCFVKYDD